MDDSRNRLALTLLFLCLFSASVFALESTSVYAGEVIEKKLPDAEQFKKGEIPEFPDVPGKYVTATLLDNTDYCLAYPDCYLILNLTSDIILIPSDVKASFKDVYGREQVREYEYEHLVEKVRTLDCPEYTTEEVSHEIFNNQTQQLETVYENITTVEYSFCGIEYYDEWVPGLPLLDAGESAVIKILTHKKPWEDIDVVPELYGIKFNEWAWQNSSFNYRVCTQANLTANVTLFSGIDLNETHTNGSDVRVVWENDTQELNFWREDTWNYSAASGDIYVNTTPIQGTNRTNAEFCIYYNASGVTDDSNVTTTFIFGDDFNDDSIDLAKWTVVTGTGAVTEHNGVLNVTNAGGTMATVTGTSNYDIVDYTFVGRCNFKDMTSYIMVGVFNGADYADVSSHASHNGAVSANAGEETTAFSNFVGGYHLFEINSSSGYTAVDFYVDGNLNATHSVQVPNVAMPAYIRAKNVGVQIECDYMLFPDFGFDTANISTWGAEEASGVPPVLISDELGPASLYKNTTAWGAVSYNHTTNTTYTAYQGLAINGAIVGGFNQTNAAYSNGTVWNYTSYDISAYTHGDNVSLWSYANVTNESGDASAIAYTANITMGNYGPDIENLTITDPLFNGTNTTGSADLWDLESDVINCQFNWYVNYSSIYNDTQAPCLNTSLFESGNYTVGEIVHFTINATDSYGDTGGPINSSEVVVAGAFTINNFTWVGIQYETVDTYDYTINFSVSGGDENVTVDLDYHDTNISVGCTNVSETYYCTLSNLEAYPIASNGTIEESTWYIQYDSPSGQINETQDFNVTIYEGIWPTNITSEAEATEKLATTINATYGYAAGIAGTVSGTTYLGSSSGTFSCASGNCTAPLTAPDVDTPTVYQIEANLTLTSSYWAESSTKEVRIEGSLTSTEPADAGSCYSGFWCSNGYDGDWGTFYRMSNLGNYINLTYNLTPPNQITYLEYKDNVGYKNISLDEDCIGTEMLFKIENEGTDDFATYCLNQSDDTFIDLGTEVGVFIDMYETRLWYLSQNNSFTSVVPYGLTDCSGAGIPILHFEVRDEHTNDLINASYAQEFYLETPAGSTAFAFSGTDDEWDICIFPDGLSANLSSFEQYSDLPDYNIRLFSIDDIEVGAAIGLLNYTRYLANDSEDYIFKTIDIFGADLQGVDITIRKFNFVTLAWEISAQATTDITGSSTFSLQPYTVYRITMNKSGYQSEEFDFVPSSIYYVEVTLHAESQLPLPTPDFTDYVWGDVAVEFSPAEGYYNSSQILRYTVLSNTSNLDYYGVSITHTENGTTTEVYSSNITVSPAGGSIQYTTTMNGTYRLYSYFKHNNYSLFDNVPRYYYINTNVTGLAKARDILEAEEPISGWGFYLALLVIAAISAGFVSRFSPEGGVIIAIIVLWMGSLLFSTVEVVNFFGTSITPIVLTGLLTIIGAGAALWRGAV